MANLYDIVSFTNDYLEIDKIKDSSPNGLQVEGKPDITHIATGVSACMELFQKADDIGANAVLVHHGMLWDSDPRRVTGSVKARLKFLFDKDISLLGYHLPLDRHPEVGNNIGLVNKLGLMEPEGFGNYSGKFISYIASTENPTQAGVMAQRVKDITGREPTHHAFGPKMVNSIAICSGGAPGLLREAIEKKADMFITGEDTEWVYHLCKEEGIHYISAGHHATERFGVIALGEKLKEKFGVQVTFIDVPNPI